MNRSNPFRNITAKQAVCAALLLAEAAAAVQVIRFVDVFGVAGMSTGAVISSTVDLLCLILGVFLFAGATAMPGNNSGFLAMAFLLHILIACDCAGWYLEGHPEYSTDMNRVMNMMFAADSLLTPVSLLMVRQLTGRGPSFKELLVNRDGFDRAEMAAAVSGTVVLLLLCCFNSGTGILYSIDTAGRFVYGPLYTAYFAAGVVGDIFGVLRLIRAGRSARQILLFLMTYVFTAAGCILNRFQISVDVGYALAFLLLFRIFSEFFSEMRFANCRYSGVLETYVSKNAATDAETEGNGSGRQYCGTVLLSDLRGFTAQSGRMSTKEMVEVLNHYMAAMMSVIREHGGSVAEFLGDGLLCVFGAPEPAEDHADRALTAAVRMQQAMEEINAWNKERGYPVLRMGIGISSGCFTYGNIGTKRVARPMAVGQPVNEVFKAEGYALGGQIVITEAGLKALKCSPFIRREFLLAPDGEPPLKLYQVSGRKDVPELLLPEKEEPLYEPEKPLHVAVRRMDGKHIDDKPAEGLLYAISPQKAVIRLPWKPEPLHYICFMPENPPQSLPEDRSAGQSAGLPEGMYYARIPASVTGNTVTADLTGLPEDMERKYGKLMAAKL